MSCSGSHLGFRIGIKNLNLVEDLPIIIPGQLGLNCSSGFREEAFWDTFHIGSNVKQSSAVADRKSKMAATAGNRLTLDPMGKCSNAFFSEIPNQTESKLDRNVHWMALYIVYVFCSNIKWKMAATAGLSLTMNPMGKVPQNASSLKPHGQYKPNCPGMIIGRFSTNFMFFMPIGNPRWLPPQYID